ncbi:NmrA family transcriptional regulator, partial [Lactiplantibacillus plantarum]
TNTTFDAALRGIQKVFFVRPPQLAKPKQDMWPFLKCLQAHHIEQVVFVSLMGVEHNPMTPHHQIEQMIEQLQLPYTCVFGC